MKQHGIEGDSPDRSSPRNDRIATAARSAAVIPAAFLSRKP